MPAHPDPPPPTPVGEADSPMDTGRSGRRPSGEAWGHVRELLTYWRARWPEALVRLGLVAPLAIWAVLVIALAGGVGGHPSPVRWMVALTWLPVFLALALGFRNRARTVVALGLWSAPVVSFFLLLSPSNDRNWEAPSSRTAHATIDGTWVTLHDIRDFRYDAHGSWAPNWYDATYDLAELEETWFVLTEFGELDGLAHVMVSFQFAGGRYVVISVEIRRQEGEVYSPLGGAFRQYELMYVVADERDAIGLRTLVHGDPTWVIPMNAGPEASRAFFMDMVERVNELHQQPAWYNTIFASCASSLADHYERVNEVRLGWDRRIFLPGFGDELLEELDLLPPGMDRAEVRRRFRVNERAVADGGSERFSRAIRSARADLNPSNAPTSDAIEPASGRVDQGGG
ncbi:MAG: DUF4105 domain-containing protein [Gemmatimonadales bacterium]|nr:MAG: DUF4105 domain-containing protein [Gemmatimonadales bacterium]